MKSNLEDNSKLLFESMDAASWSSDEHFAYSSLWRVCSKHASSDGFLTVTAVVSCAKLCDGSMGHSCQCNDGSENSKFHVEKLNSNRTD